LPSTWAIASVTLDGTDVTDAPANFAAGEHERQLRVVLTAATGSIAGSVSGAAPTDGPVRVIVFAEDSQRWGFFSRAIRSADVDAAGHFSMDGVLPGRYLAVAAAQVDAGAWLDPEVLERLRAQATPIEVRAGRLPDLSLSLRRLP
jgi:hypothetical protein